MLPVLDLVWKSREHEDHKYSNNNPEYTFDNEEPSPGLLASLGKRHVVLDGVCNEAAKRS